MSSPFRYIEQLKGDSVLIIGGSSGKSIIQSAYQQSFNSSDRLALQVWDMV